MATWIAAFTALAALPIVANAYSARADFDILRHTGVSDGPRILFVPGNPGIPRFYAAVARELADATRGDVAVLGLRGFVDGRRRVSKRWWADATRWAANRPRGAFSVEEQIAHVAGAIDREVATAQKQGRRFVVVTHSIGGYFALKARRDVPVVCVTPYLENREEDPAFRKLRGLVTSPLAPVIACSVASFATLLGMVPKAVRRRLLRAAGATQGHGPRSRGRHRRDHVRVWECRHDARPGEGRVAGAARAVRRTVPCCVNPLRSSRRVVRRGGAPRRPGEGRRSPHPAIDGDAARLRDTPTRRPAPRRHYNRGTRGRDRGLNVCGDGVEVIPAP